MAGEPHPVTDMDSRFRRNDEQSLLEFFIELLSQDSNDVASDEAFRLRGVSFRYPGQQGWALRDVSLTVRRGEMVVVMGGTGAGKSTLAKLLNRTVPGFQPGELRGAMSVHGRELTSEGVADLAGVVGLVSQDFEAQLFATNVVQEIAFGMEQLGVAPKEMRERVPAALEKVGLRGFEQRDPSTLSGGEKQRLAIAATLAMHPSILVFDEPTTDLDPLGKLEIFDVLAQMRREGYTLVVIEHETAAAELADRLVLMSEGTIMREGHPRELLADVEALEQHGVRPPDLSRTARELGWSTVPESVDEAAERLVGRVSIASPAVPPAAATDTVPLVHAENVRFEYEGGQNALRGVSLMIRAGEFVALIGQNGSGKTTLAKHLNGLLRPSSGRVLLHGRDVAGLQLNDVARDVGYVFQNPDNQIFAATVFDEVAFGPRNLGCEPAELEERIQSSLEAVGLIGYEAEDPFILGKGYRQRLAVASLLAMRPQLLILDEPTTGLDYLEQEHMMGLVRQLHERGIAILMITHSPWVVAEYAQRGVLMRGGAVQFDGPLRALFAEESLLEAARFRVPDVTRLGNRLGFTPLSVGELVARVGGR